MASRAEPSVAKPPASAPEVLESFSPTNGKRLGSVPSVAPEDVQQVVDEVAQVQPIWAQLRLEDRARYLRRAAEPIDTPQPFLKTKRSAFAYDPLGVVAVIAPWNYPWSIPLGEVAMALMAGNGVGLKPASLTCLGGERIRQVVERAGLPEGLVRTVHGGGSVGNALVESSVDKVFFTGSV